MSEFKIAMESKVEDRITGFLGVITGRAEYLTGCRQYSVSAPSADGKIGDVGWYDEDRLTVTADPVQALPARNAGGPQGNPAPAR